MIASRQEIRGPDVARHYDELDRFYRDIWGEHVHHGLWLHGNETQAQAVRQLAELVGREAAVAEGSRVIDIGCGYGATARLLAEEFAAEVTGITISEAQYNIAVGTAGLSRPRDLVSPAYQARTPSALGPAHPTLDSPANPTFLLGDWLENDLPAESFDAAIAIESSEHMPDKPAFFAQAWRVLRPGARLVVCSWLSCAKPTASQQRWLLEPVCREGRMPHLGTESDYRQLAAEARFDVVRFQDVTRQIARTWPMIVRVFLWNLLRKPFYLRFILDPKAQNAVFALTIVRLWIAFRTGAMRYGVFTLEEKVGRRMAMAPTPHGSHSSTDLPHNRGPRMSFSAPPSIAPSPFAFRLSPFWSGLWSLALFAAVLWLDTRYNQFPYFYHPDEPVKVEQVRTGDWNYHHPMLLLTVTKAVVKICGVAPKEQSIVEAGRWVSAAFAGAAIVLLSWLAFVWRGWPAAVATGLALLVHHQFFELAHYLKEDTALVFGVAFTFLVAFLFSQKPARWLAGVLGVATACAISGKYIGVVMLAVVLPLLWFSPREGRAMRWGAFLVLLGATLLVVNLPLILHPAAFAHSFDREMELVVRGQQGATRRVPHALYLNIFRDNTTPVMWVLLLVFLAERWRERRALTLVEWLLIVFPFAFTLMLSFSPKSNDRYYLPATGIFTLFAAVGALDAARLLVRWVPLRWGTLALIVVLVGAQLPGWWRYEAAFLRDDNREMLDWVKANLPPSAVIAKDSRVLLPDPANRRDATRFAPMPQKIIASKFAADLGTIDELRRKGVTHVAISESDYGRFFLDGLRVRGDEAGDFERRKAFYTELLRDGTLLFERERDTVLYLHPGIRIYQMPLPD